MPVLRPQVSIIALIVPQTLFFWRKLMTTKLISELKTKVLLPQYVRAALFVMVLVLFALGAGAPSDGGGLGGF
jgi:hypothetical protein